ncbi:MAG: hypothetical protein U9N53_10720 [Bacteroidota bacterium]|nr:hypothetical protein [Bacteroidota bacterium]
MEYAAAKSTVDMLHKIKSDVIFIPSIVIAEAISIFDKKRVSFDFRNLFKKIKSSENFVLIALDYPILEKMVG